MFWQRLHDLIVFLLHVERRFEPFFRGPVDAVLREPAAALIQCLINAQRRDEGLALAEEKLQPGEEEHLQSIIDTMAEYMRRHWQPGNYQRAGNTKTHGVVRGEVAVRGDLPAAFRRGVFAEPKTYPAWVRFSGPGPDWPRDIDDVGFVSCAIKIMGVAGAKLLEDEKFTQDFLSICTPTFVTPDTRANAKLQAWILKGTPLYYFSDPTDSHILDGLMQSWWNKTQSNPLGERYWSCVPYLLGEGQAMMYSVYPRSKVYRHIPRLPLSPPDNYLRDNMVRTLQEQDVRVRSHAAAPDRPIPHADRERGGALAGEALALRAGSTAPYPAAEIRCAGSTRLCRCPLLQPLALHRRAPPPRQSEPGAAPDVLGAVAIPAENERHAACRADRE